LALLPHSHDAYFSPTRRASRLNSSTGHGCSGRLAGNAAIRTRHRSRVRARVAPATHELRTKTVLTRLHTNRVARKERGFPDEPAVAKGGCETPWESSQRTGPGSTSGKERSVSPPVLRRPVYLTRHNRSMWWTATAAPPWTTMAASQGRLGRALVECDRPHVQSQHRCAGMSGFGASLSVFSIGQSAGRRGF
jgi:hypothetical protein